MTDQTRSSRQERKRGRQVLDGHFRRYESRDRLTIIPSPTIESVTAGSALGRRRDGMLELAPLRLEVPKPVLNHQQQVLDSVNECLDSTDGEYEYNDGQSEESEESEEENELSQHGDDADHQSVWEPHRPIGRELLSSQLSILTITPGNTQSSSTRISYPGQGMSALVRFSQNDYTSVISFRSPTVLNPPTTLAIIQSHPDPTMLELDSRGGQQASSRRNIATELDSTIVAKVCDFIWDLTIFVNWFLDPFTPTEEVCAC